MLSICHYCHPHSKFWCGWGGGGMCNIPVLSVDVHTEVDHSTVSVLVSGVVEKCENSCNVSTFYTFFRPDDL